MKKIFALASLLLLSNQALASEARLIALGLDELDNEGSYYISDSRNIFLNAANINNYANMVIVELGGIGRQVGPMATINADNNAKPQGGFLMKAHNYVFGAYMGMESNQSSMLRIASSSNAGTVAALTSGGSGARVPTADNQVDLFFGGEAGVKWGINATYLNNKDNAQNLKESASAVRLGVIADRWDFHVNMSTSNKAEITEDVTFNPLLAALDQAGVKNEFKGKFGIQTGGSFDMGDGHKVYASYKTFSWEQTDGYDYNAVAAIWAPSMTAAAALDPAFANAGIGKSGKSDGDFTTIIIGYGKEEAISSTTKLFYNAYLKKVNIELELASKAEVDLMTLPVTFGFETQATSWLTLRGSVTQDIYTKRDNKNFNSANLVAQQLIGGVYGSQGEGTLQNTTRVHAGASLNFGNLTIDGVIGTTSESRAGGAEANSKTTGVLALDNLMTRVAMTYTF